MALLAVLVALSFGAQTASATPSAVVLPPVTGYADVTVEDYHLGGYDSSGEIMVPPASLPLSLTASDEDDADLGSGSAEVSMVGGLDPVILESASSTNSMCGLVGCFGDETATAVAHLNYSFMIVGPTTAAAIPVLFRGSNSSSLTVDSNSGYATSDASVTVTDASGNVIQSESGGAFDVPLHLTVGSVYNVQLDVLAQATGGKLILHGFIPGSISISAFADPRFTIDSSFANANAYTITYSPGLVGGVVPEPSSLLLLGTGLAGLLLARRHARDQL